VDDAALRRRIGENARRKAAERYSLEANAAAWTRCWRPPTRRG
jgi:glycosyltransferase involved in cell wall biosynthesis